MESLCRQAKELGKLKQTWKRIEWEESFYPTLRLAMAPFVKTVALEEGQTHRWMEQKKESRNSLTEVEPTDFQQCCKSYSMEEW